MKMRIVLTLFLSLTCSSSLIAQVNQQAAVNNLSHPGNTYAVIIGISKYQNGITQLDFAHKDAQVFADYLKSNAGGSVPEDNIRLLVNENATFAAIYDALNWLLETSQKNDLVYFYFSGHGDMENNTIYELGFLLSYNTPRINYINNAVRIEDLNNIANTLSVKNKAKVVLITDACHSGNLAGKDFRGTFLVGDQLRAVLGSEVRITSCAPDQLSNEDEGWGGGRGVFSYYLINGLKGLADYGKDGAITVNEIKNYLDTSLSNDRLLAEKAHKQNPVIKGLDNVKLATVDNATLRSLMQGQSSQLSFQNSGTFLKPLAMQPQAYLFSLIGKNEIEKIIDFNKLTGLTKDEIPFAFIRMIADATKQDAAIDHEKIASIEKTIKENKDALGRFNNKLVVMLSDRGQEIINQYLDGDEAELDRRRYYNSEMNRYDIYPKMFAVALKLTPSDNALYRILNIKLHYFAGVAARLKIPMVENMVPLLDIAMSEQNKALELEENAAYIQNELGILYKLKKDYATAEKYFLRATQRAPQWALPWSNLGGLYAATNSYEKGIVAVEKAKELQPGFQGTFINSGILYEKKGNLLLAEEFLRKSIKLNSRHYLPFERLGYVYMNTTQYALANSFFYEAEKRKKGYHLAMADSDGDGVTDQFDQEMHSPCYFDSLDIKQNDIMGHFVWGLIEYKASHLNTAEREFKKVIALDKTNPLAFHYLGELLYKQKRWKEAEIIFNYALSFYLNEVEFRNYQDSLAKLTPASKSGFCIAEMFSKSHYERIEDRYFLAAVYESWNHYAEAEQQYRKIIKTNPQFSGGYYKLWSMLEKIGHYNDAEKIILSLRNYHREISNNELNAFYERMTNRFPQHADWHHKAGLFLYELVAPNWAQYKWDDYPDTYRSLIPPDKKEDILIEADQDGVQDIFETIDEEGEITNPPEGWVLLPGIKEDYVPAGNISSPYFGSIAYLKKADSLIQQEDAVADINNKIGDLYVWQSLYENALPYYKKSIELKPADAGTRIKLVKAASFSFYLKDALEQLDSLYQSKEINFSSQLRMSEYCIHAGRFADALNLLKEAQQIHPYKTKEITDLNGRLQLLSNNPKQALTFYKDYSNNNSDDDFLTMYTIAKLYARMKNTNEAWKWLKLSIDKGFNYYWVLKYDSTWDNFRKPGKWKDITGKIPVPEL